MAKKKEDKYSSDDRNAARTDMPGSRPQTPAEDYVIRMPSTGEVIGGSRMNYAGVAGGLPTANARALRERAGMYEDYGNTSSAAAARMRARNVEGHDRLTRESKREIELRRLKAAAEAPGASTYAKDRYRMAKSSGMVNRAKGGKVKKMAKGGSASSRGDGCARKGKTKGKFV